jgi:O-methyltransferase domain
VLDHVGPGRFALTEVAALLRTGVPGSLRPSVLLWLDESHWRPWGHLLHTVRTGGTAFNHTHGTGLFDYLAGHPEGAAALNAGMTGNSPAHARLVAAAYDFAEMSVVVDVGGGRGRLLATILERYPRLRGTLFDQSHVIADARHIPEELGVIDRGELVGGSFFDAVPTGGDVAATAGRVALAESTCAAVSLAGARHGRIARTHF